MQQEREKNDDEANITRIEQKAQEERILFEAE